MYSLIFFIGFISFKIHGTSLQFNTENLYRLFKASEHRHFLYIENHHRLLKIHQATVTFNTDNHFRLLKIHQDTVIFIYRKLSIVGNSSDYCWL